MDFQAEQWYNGGFRGQAPRPEKGTIVEGDIYRVADLWCSVWYTRFIGTKEECEAWIRKYKKEWVAGVDMKVEKWFDIFKKR